MRAIFPDKNDCMKTDPVRFCDIFIISTRFVKKYTHVRRLQVEATTPYGVVAIARLLDSTVTKPLVDESGVDDLLLTAVRVSPVRGRGESPFPMGGRSEFERCGRGVSGDRIVSRWYRRADEASGCCALHRVCDVTPT